ncbi:MAG: CDP-alcohol phosphatidyltransferase family protein [Patescibacteria group bacterium]
MLFDKNDPRSLVQQKDDYLAAPLKEFRKRLERKIAALRIAKRELPLGLYLFDLLVVRYSVIPNLLTITRLCLFWALYSNLKTHDNETALFIFTTAILTDFADGVLARGFSNITRFGKIADPLADKLITGAVLFGMYGDIPSWLFWSIFSIATFLISITALLLTLKWLINFQREVQSNSWGKWKFFSECVGYSLLFIVRFLAPSTMEMIIYYGAIIALIISLPLAVCSIIEYIVPGKLPIKFGKYQT